MVAALGSMLEAAGDKFFVKTVAIIVSWPIAEMTSHFAVEAILLALLSRLSVKRNRTTKCVEATGDNLNLSTRRLTAFPGTLPK